MSFALDSGDLNPEEKSYIIKNYTVKKNKSNYNQNPEKIPCFAFNKSEGNVYLPLGSWNEFYEEFPHHIDDYSKINVKFKKKLYTLETDPRGIRDQDVLAKEALSKLRKQHSCLIACFTGFGKTLTSIYLATKLKMKTAVLVFHDEIQKQWMDEIRKHTDAKVQFINTSKEELDQDADFYIIGLLKAKSMSREQFQDIGIVIMDEVHYAIEAGFCKVLFKFQPYYLIGASATPDRPDGLHKILYLYFGKKENFIVRKETGKKFKVIKYRTKYRPNIVKVIVYGKVIDKWTEIQSSISRIPERQQEIAKIARDHPDEKIMILSDRKEQSKSIYEILKDDPGGAELFIGNKKKRDVNKRVLVAGTKKAGIGFNDPDLTMLILANDSKDVRQYEGRLRTENCIIYDIVDDYRTFEDHSDLRDEWFIEKGAEIICVGEPKRYYSRKKKGQRQRFLKPNK
jgi:superfamily II DNA or RNA helicase